MWIDKGYLLYVCTTKVCNRLFVLVTMNLRILRSTSCDRSSQTKIGVVFYTFEVVEMPNFRC